MKNQYINKLLKTEIMNIRKTTKSIVMTTSIIAGGYLNAHAQDSAQKSSPGDLVNALHSAFGKHESRAVHAKGIILEGTFVPSKDAAKITKAVHLQNQASKVLLRFSDFTGIPNIPDNNPAANPRGLGIKFIMPDNTTTDIISHSFNGFPTATSDEFRQLLMAIAASGPDAKKPTALDNFLATHPIAKTFLTTQHITSSFATINYFGVNSFKFTNSKGVSHFIRYQFITEAGEKYITAEASAKENADYLFLEIKKRIAKGPVKFKLYAQLAEKGDKIEDPSIAWPDSRRRILLGEITLIKLADNTTEGDKKFVINPGNIPDGIEMADPMLELRAKAYPISVKERQ
jgi:catalase